MDFLEKFVTGVGVGVIALIIVIVVALIGSVITWWAWNFFMPAIFGLPKIGILQAFAFNLLAANFRSSFSTKKE